MHSNKKNLHQKASLVASGFVSSKGKFLGDVHWYAIHWRGVGGVRGGTFLIKEQWEKSLLSLGAKNSDGHLLHCCK